MAAVAGSKGRIKVRGPDTKTTLEVSFQAKVTAQVISGALSPSGAAEALLSAARLREVGVDTNMICNLSCAYCYLADRREEKGSLPLDFVSTFLKDCIGAGAKLIAFIGKEPLGDDRAITLAKLLREGEALRPFRTGMVTNGTLIDRRLQGLISARFDYLDVSLDGFREANDALRGTGAYDAALKGLKLAVRNSVASDLATTTVLSAVSRPKYFDFADQMFETGVTTCFASPVLRFATTNSQATRDVALSTDEADAFISDCVDWANRRELSPLENRQLLIDLPYRYSWQLLASGSIDIDDVCEDEYEAHFWRPDPGVAVIVKLNFVPMSYWRAFRLTHDGRMVLNMDLAAHRDYEGVSPMAELAPNSWWRGQRSTGAKILEEFFVSMLHALGQRGHACERGLERQFGQMKFPVAA